MSYVRARFVARSTLALLVGRWVLQIGLAHTWLVVALSMFASTRLHAAADRFVLAPLSHLAERIAGALPLILVAAIAGLAVIILVRFAAAFFDSVARGQTHAAWLPRIWRDPRASSYVPASLPWPWCSRRRSSRGTDGALARIGTITLVVLGLAVTPLAACAAVGASVVYLRNVREGEIIEFGGARGACSRSACSSSSCKTPRVAKCAFLTCCLSCMPRASWASCRA